MLLAGEFLFVALLLVVLYLLYKNEHFFGKSRLSRAVIEECWDGKDRRKRARFDKTLDVIYSLEKKPHLKNNGRTVNISETGAKLLLDKKLSIGTILDLKLQLPVNNSVVEIEGRVVWSEEAKSKDADDRRFFHAGIEFFAIKEPHSMSFIGYIRSLEGKP